MQTIAAIECRRKRRLFDSGSTHECKAVGGTVACVDEQRDANRAMALPGNTPDAFGKTWHLPCDYSRLTYRQFIELAAQAFGQPAAHRVVAEWMLKLAGLFNPIIRDAGELLPRYLQDNVFSSDRFKQRFPDFQVTRIKDGLQAIATEWLATAR